MLGRLVAHHSFAIVEPDEHGLTDVLGLEFEPVGFQYLVIDERASSAIHPATRMNTK